MVDLPEAINPERKAEIDTVGWLTGVPSLPPCFAVLAYLAGVAR
jgi:hypothetical protein